MGIKGLGRGALLGLSVAGLGMVFSVPAASAAVATPSVKVTNVVVQGGTTPTDSGLLQAVIEPGFKKAYPQYNLQYVSVGTGQAITNAEAGEADAVFTHSPTLEASFVAGGYSYEHGGRLVMSSDFITVGPNSDPAGVTTGTPSDVVAAFQEIAAAGSTGNADFVSRGDQSGTNTKELAIWVLVNKKDPSITLNTLNEPGPTGTTSVDSWYHTTGVGQGQNLEITDQCPFSSGACYTVADRGTFNEGVSLGDLPDLQIVSQGNTGAAAENISGDTPDLLANPYHAYAVNPQSEPGVHINLAGALAFLDYLTSPAAQAAIGAYPSTADPAFTPDARPVLTATQKLPASAKAGVAETVSGTLKPAFDLDPPLTGQTVILERTSDSLNVATTTVAADGTFSFTFKPPTSGNYTFYVGESLDNIVTNGFRQSTHTGTGTITVTTVVTIAKTGHSGDSVSLSGSLTPAPTTSTATVQIQMQPSGGGAWQNVGSPVALSTGATSYATTVTAPSAGKWNVRAQYNDPGLKSGVSGNQLFSAP